jgi:hypothetical protein
MDSMTGRRIMDLSRRRYLCSLVLVAGVWLLSSAQTASGQGLFSNCWSALGCGPCDCSSGSWNTGLAYGESTGATTGAGGDQFAGSPLDLGEAGPAQYGSTFAAVDSAYIDDARVRTIARFRFDAAYNNVFPDRAEFFYAQCGCFGNGAPGPGDARHLANKIDYQEFWGYYENAFSDRFSAFIDVPFRLVNFQLDPAIAAANNGAQGIPNSGGLSDIHFGAKYALVADPYRYDTIQVRIYTPTGDADRGLGTNHFTIEPAYLAFRQLSNRLRFNGEFRAWVPISDSQAVLNGQTKNFAGTVLRYGAGLSYDLYQSCDCPNDALSAVTEFVGWTVLSGLKFNPDPRIGVQDASGDTIVNGKFGLRYRWSNQSVYAGYGVALTSQNWYTDIIRAEYTYRF